MIDNYLLEELVTFKKYGTLAATAEQLLVTQPTVTRGMQKLEDELNVKIFDRQPNHISLTKTGELAAKEAQKVLDQNNNFVETIRKYEDSHKVLRIGSVVPGPMILLRSLKDLPTEVELSDDLLADDSVIGKLENNDFSFVLTDKEIMTDTIESRYIGSEHLSVNLDKFTYLANQNSVTFKELKGMSFVVISDIGLWKQIIQDNIPDAKFLYQEQTEAFTEITRYSNFPYFNTNISGLDNHLQTEDDDRVRITISDDASTIDLYAAYLKKQKKRVAPVIKTLTQKWQQS
ncbi:LysR family transcriptional regulator [Companilactobacillus kimchiensis]|uniref:LysR family transcriptional regulator n=1 Tax=Companilactobacillus kimchiensis TaxID=993692 RepID=A0A0R2LAH0_9LACO|nr:LysR family transcriptional regulator [Companilactobacillus kimchiensis]KRN98857.1 LysR family transcriptional regulator [Companilactobacillus kimchiensis]